MKRTLALMAFIIAAAAAPAALASVSEGAQAERRVSAAPDVLVELSLASGGVIVRGWGNAEVSARSAEAQRIEMRRYGAGDKPSGDGDSNVPARRVEIFALNSKDEDVWPGEFSGSGNIELNVPHGATVVLRVQSGEVEVSDVAVARINCASGDLELSNISRRVEAEVFSGNITLTDSRGSVSLKSVSGMIEATNLSPNDAKDFFVIKSMSGDVTLEDVRHAKVESETLSGSVRFSGSLAPDGGYMLRTHSGDVTMAIPQNSSFKVSARIVMGGEIVSDFAVKRDAQPVSQLRTLLEGVVGAGGAEVNLTSFNGTVHLRKR